jgi:hypothetical protein
MMAMIARSLAVHSTMRWGGRARTAGIVHQLAEHGAEQEKREELDQVIAQSGHEYLRIRGEDRRIEVTQEKGDESTDRRNQDDVPAAIGENDQQQK